MPRTDKDDSVNPVRYRFISLHLVVVRVGNLHSRLAVKQGFQRCFDVLPVPKDHMGDRGA